MNRKDLLAIIKEARAMVKYWANYTHEDELTKMTAIFELCSWKERLGAAREEIKKWGVYYLIQEPMVILFQLMMYVVFWGIHIYVFSILWSVLNYAEWWGWLFWPISLLCIVPAWYAGYYIACAVDTMIERWYIAKCDDVLDRIDHRVQVLLKQ